MEAYLRVRFEATSFRHRRQGVRGQEICSNLFWTCIKTEVATSSFAQFVRDCSLSREQCPLQWTNKFSTTKNANKIAWTNWRNKFDQYEIATPSRVARCYWRKTSDCIVKCFLRSESVCVRCTVYFDMQWSSIPSNAIFFYLYTCGWTSAATFQHL